MRSVADRRAACRQVLLPSQDTERHERCHVAPEGGNYRTRTRHASTPAVLTPLDDAQVKQRLEVSCLVRVSKASSMITDVSRLLFDEGVDVIQADTLLDGDYVSMFFVLKSTRCGPRSWKALLSKVNAAVLAAGYDVACPQSCTCQAHSVNVETHSQSMYIPQVWDALLDCGLQVLSCSMQRHRQTTSGTTSSAAASLHSGTPVGDTASRCSAEAHDASDMSFLVVDTMQELSSAERQSTVAARIMDACCAKDDATCSIHITERGPDGLDAPDGLTSSPCCCQQRWQPSGCAPLHSSDCYLEHRADGRKRFVTACADENLEAAAVELYVDDRISKASTCIEIECRDRKGLLYDAMRTVEAAGMLVTQARCSTQRVSKATIQLFVQDNQLQPLQDDSRLLPLLQQLLHAVAQPFSVAVMASEEGTVDVVVVTPLDAQRRGRPRVTRDVAAALSGTPLSIEAAFVGPLEHCAGQDRVPGDVLNDMMSTLHLPEAQGRGCDRGMPSWAEEVNNRLLVCTPRVTDSPLFSPCAQEAMKDSRGAHGGGGCGASLAAHASRAPSDHPPPAPSCDARSAASDDGPALPVLHDLEQHFCSAFLDDDFVPGKDRPPPQPAAEQRSLPAGLLAAAADAADGVWVGDRAGVGVRAGGAQTEANLETGLSFFGPATAHSHFPEELSRMVEVHHFVAVADGPPGGAECSSLAALRRQLHSTVVGALLAR